MKILVDYKNATILFLLLVMVAIVNPVIAQDDDSEVSTAPTYETESPSTETISDEGSDVSGFEDSE